MAEEPDRLRQNIEDTRATLTRDVDLLASKTSPRQVARRRWTAVKERVMGTTQDTRATVQDKAQTAQDKAHQLTGKAGTAAEKVKEAPQAITSQAQGNPVAAGIIAFGVGMLAASIVPVTDAERRAGQQLKEHSGDLTDKVKDVATDLKDDIGGTVHQAAGEIKETARDAAQATKETARSDAQDVRDQTRQSSTM